MSIKPYKVIQEEAMQQEDVVEAHATTDHQATGVDPTNESEEQREQE